MATAVERLEALLAEQEAAVARAFRNFIRAVNSPAVVERLIDLLERRDVEGALALVDSYVVRFGDVIPVIHQVVGAATALELGAQVHDIVIAIGFDPSHPRAAQIARANRLNLVRNFSTEQRSATRQALARAFESGAGTAETARAFRGSIGLSSFHERWVNSFETSLRTLDSKALDRALRDRRFDGTLQRAIDLNRPLTEKQITTMVDRYRARALSMRSENIARSEAIRATSEAREESLQQMIEQTNMDPQRVRRIWNATHDKRVRDFHRSMDLQERGIGESFEDGHENRLRWPGDPLAAAETTINCRCTTTFRIEPPA